MPKTFPCPLCDAAIDDLSDGDHWPCTACGAVWAYSIELDELMLTLTSAKQVILGCVHWERDACAMAVEQALHEILDDKREPYDARIEHAVQAIRARAGSDKT